MSDGAMTISSQMVAGGNSGQSGDTRTAETYTSDQYSQVQVTSTQLTGGQWIGPAVRSQNSGRTCTWASTSGTAGHPSCGCISGPGKLDPARLVVSDQRAGRRSDARADRHWLHDLVPA